MYKTTYVCDCCGKEMQSPMYTLELKTNSLCIQDRAGWHYCNDCWGYIKKRLTLKESELDDLVLEKAVARFKEANKDWDNAVKWYGPLFALALAESIQQEKKNVTYSSPYYTYTVNTNGEKIIQAKPASDGPFTAGCCCEDTNKDSLDYKQTTGI